MKATYFATPDAFRGWLEKNHREAKELLVGFHKRGSGRPSLTWPEAVDQALCFGWIDGVRKRVDDGRYTIRFTPRRARSIWSAINIGRVTELAKLGLMRPAGLEAFARRSEEKSRTYSYEQRHSARLRPDEQKRLQADRGAWAFFQAQAPSYRQLATYWVVSAKKEVTRRQRLDRLIATSAGGRRV